MSNTSWVIVGAIWGYVLGQLLLLLYDLHKSRRQ